MASVAMAKKKLGRPVTSARDDISVKFDRKLAGKARQIALGRGISLAEYISELTRSAIDADYVAFVKALGD